MDTLKNHSYQKQHPIWESYSPILGKHYFGRHPQIGQKLTTSNKARELNLQPVLNRLILRIDHKLRDKFLLSNPNQVNKNPSLYNPIVAAMLYHLVRSYYFILK